MTDIKAVLASNLKKFRQSHGWTQEILAERTGTSTNYIGMLETMRKFPSSSMVQKLASALCIDPTELFWRDPLPEELAKTARREALKEIGEAAGRFFSEFITAELKKTAPE